MMYRSMASELTELVKEGGLASKALGYFVKPTQQKKLLATGRSIVRDPKKIMQLPGKALRQVRTGTKAGFREGGTFSKGLHGLALAEPALTARSMAKHPQEFQGRKGRTLGESIGGSAAYLASARLPLAGAIGVGIAGQMAGGRIGSMLDRSKRMAKPPSLPKGR